jgi:hypothetical protein
MRLLDIPPIVEERPLNSFERARMKRFMILKRANLLLKNESLTKSQKETLLKSLHSFLQQ